jgi:16S rRNA (uracil1498-N3)-methyltransferase
LTRRRWIADEVYGDRATLVGAQAAHLARVLRARVGQEYDVAAAGRVRRARVVSVSDDCVEFDLGEDIAAKPAPEVIVLLSIFKFDRMEWAIEKLAELGAARIVPLVASRTESHLAKAADKRIERWRRIAREAAQQARRAAPPEIASPVRLKEALGVRAATRVVLSEAETEVSIKQLLTQAAPVALAFGPEGGWTSDELRAFAQSGWSSASLGSTILRAETAAIAAVAVALAELT